MRTRLVAAVALVVSACRPAVDDDRAARASWVQQQTAAHDWYVRDVLNGTSDVDFYDGWYAPENDPKTGGAWRWMARRGIVRLRARVNGAPTAVDMSLTINGWVPWQDVGLRTTTLQVAVNGHVLETFDPPHETFAHSVFVPRFLLEKSDWVDLVITAANTARPRGDWRDLGFCTTGFLWKPAS